MKLFVWANPYSIPYGTSGLFVVAEDEAQARELAKSGECYSYVEYAGGKSAGSIDLGPPTRVVDVPCAEWHEWSE